MIEEGKKYSMWTRWILVKKMVGRDNIELDFELYIVMLFIFPILVI